MGGNEPESTFDVLLDVSDRHDAGGHEPDDDVSVEGASAGDDGGCWGLAGAEPLSDTRRGRADFGRYLPG